ncbi:hypothetical protein [Mucilaginibacter sp. 3215]|uniref:hypothetical protein n=1 Tax=Mucilaginibacter sp. 3215 TaxID=3373912 RepID=UPI003D2366FD
MTTKLSKMVTQSVSLLRDRLIAIKPVMCKAIIGNINKISLSKAPTKGAIISSAIIKGPPLCPAANMQNRNNIMMTIFNLAMY